MRKKILAFLRQNRTSLQNRSDCDSFFHTESFQSPAADNKLIIINNNELKDEMFVKPVKIQKMLNFPHFSFTFILQTDNNLVIIFYFSSAPGRTHACGSNLIGSEPGRSDWSDLGRGFPLQNGDEHGAEGSSTP